MSEGCPPCDPPAKRVALKDRTLVVPGSAPGHQLFSSGGALLCSHKRKRDRGG